MLTPFDIHAELEILHEAIRLQRKPAGKIMRNNKLLPVLAEMGIVHTQPRAGSIWIGAKPSWAMADEVLAKFHAVTRKPRPAIRMPWKPITKERLEEIRDRFAASQQEESQPDPDAPGYEIYPWKIRALSDPIAERLERVEQRQDAILSALTTLAAKMGAAHAAAEAQA